MPVAASPRLGSGAPKAPAAPTPVLEARDLAVDLLARVGLEPAAADRYPHPFIDGQWQRLCIARALNVQPALIAADEPVPALDASVARQVTDPMAELQARGGVAFLFMSHGMAVAERVSHRIGEKQAGRIVETGPAAKVLAHPARPYTRRLMAAVPVPDPAPRHRPRAVLRPLAEPPALLLPAASAPHGAGWPRWRRANGCWPAARRPFA